MSLPPIAATDTLPADSLYTYPVATECQCGKCDGDSTDCTVRGLGPGYCSFSVFFLFYFTKRGAIRLQLLLKRQSLLATPARRAPTHPLASAHAHSSFSMNSYSTSKTQFMTLPLKPSPSRQVCLIPKPSLVLLLFCVSAPLNSSSLNPRSVSKGSVSSSSAPARCSGELMRTGSHAAHGTQSTKCSIHATITWHHEARVTRTQALI